MKSKNLIVVAVVIIITLVGAFVAIFQSNNESSPSPTTQSGDTSQPNNPEAEIVPPPKAYPVSVYFSKHPDSDNDPAKTFPVRRTSPDLGVANIAIKQLLKGPTDTEAKQGFFSTVQLRNVTGTNDFKLVIKEGVATLQFLKTFDHRGSVADGQADSAIKATLLQFESIKKVVVLNSQGDCEFDLSGMNKCLQ